MKKISHREAFIHTKRYFGITGAALSRQTGIDHNRISEFINLKKDGSGEYKRDLSSSVLDRLVEGMDEIEAGAKLFYLQELAGNDTKISFNPVTLVNSLDNKQISELMFAIAARMGDKSAANGEEKRLVLSH